jgi:hypothetical protein
MPRTKSISSLAPDEGAPIGTPLAQKRRVANTSPIFAERMRAAPQDSTGFAVFETNTGHKPFGELARSGLLDACEYYATTRLSWEEIRRGRETVERLWLEKSGPRKRGEQHKLSKAELNRMFVLYDWHFFGGAFERALSERAQKLEIVQSAALSPTLTSSRAKCIRHATGHSCTYTIEITPSVGKYFDPGRYGHETHDDDEVFPTYSVGGLLCRSWLECTQLLLEHEIVHLLMFMWHKCEDPDKAPGGTSHGETWQRLARNIFGHYKHTSALNDDSAMYDSGRAEKEWEVAERVRRTMRVGSRLYVGPLQNLYVVETLPEATEQNEYFEARSVVFGTEHRVRYLAPFRVCARP